MAWWKKSSRTPADAEKPADMPLIRLQGISKVFKGDADEETWALRNITLDIDRGEFISVAGPSGCGKSTFLSMLALLDTPTAGHYWLNGKRTDRMTPTERTRARNLDIGLVFQSFNLIGDMTVYENVEYPLTLRGVAAADRTPRVNAALERVGLIGRAKSRPGSLSGGHQQLVAVARAITGRPAILLADEPTGNLDSKSGESLMQLFSELHANGATVCVVTHDPRWLAQARRHIYLFDGALANGEESGDRVIG